MAVADRSLPAGTVAITGALYMEELKAEIEKLWGISTTNLSSVAGTNTITAVADPAITSYVDGQKFLLPVLNSNTGATTLNINAVGAKAVLDSAGAAVTTGALLAGTVALLVFRTADNGFRILTSSSSAGQKVNTQESTDATGAWTWTKPAGYAADSRVLIEMISNGGSGASRLTTGDAAGGGGGGYLLHWCKLSDLSATETGTIPAPAAGVSGDINGNQASVITFTRGAKTLSVKGGFAPSHGALGAGATGGASGKPNQIGTNAANPTWPVASAPASVFVAGGAWGAAGGSVSTADVPVAGGDSDMGSGAGGGCSSTAGGTRTGGVSIEAGNGGAGGANTGGAGGAGSYPGGGGGGAVQGGTSGAGARGRIRVSVYPA